MLLCACSRLISKAIGSPTVVHLPKFTKQHEFHHCAAKGRILMQNERQWRHPHQPHPHSELQVQYPQGINGPYCAREIHRRRNHLITSRQPPLFRQSSRTLVLLLAHAPLSRALSTIILRNLHFRRFRSRTFCPPGSFTGPSTRLC